VSSLTVHSPSLQGLKIQVAATECNVEFCETASDNGSDCGSDCGYGYSYSYGSGFGRTNDTYKSTAKNPIGLIHDRVLPGNVLVICLAWLGALAQTDLIGRAIEILKSWQAKEPPSRSFMSERFHPAINASWITPADLRDAEWLARKCGLTTSLPQQLATPDDVLQLFGFIDQAKNALGVIGIKGFVKTSSKSAEAKAATHALASQRARRSKKVNTTTNRKTCRAEFLLDRTTRSSGLSYQPDFVRALKALSKWIGRIQNWFDPWITARSLQIAKSGLASSCIVTVAEKLSGSVEAFEVEFPLTSVFMALAVSEFSTRKAFTLESQSQGALNEHLQALLALVTEHEPRGLSAVALVLPLSEIYSRIPKEVVELIYSSWMKWAPLFGKFLQVQWDRGVWRCARRQMRVPPSMAPRFYRAVSKPSGYSGKPVNSSGYNAVADGWNNLVRGIRVAVSVGGINGSPFFIKIMQLIANDQFQWGQRAGKGVHPDVSVFDAITRQGIIPWQVVTSNPESMDTMRMLTCLSEACKASGVSLDSWVGLPQMRVTEVRHHVDMICGCAVPSMSVECADFLKSLGLFGAGDWSG
jgi:hypothetical protein